MLAKALIERGHNVELWTSTFDHANHQHICNQSFIEKIGDRISIQFIKGCGYASDISLKRLLHNRQTSREFIRLANGREEFPDIIFTQIPILELAQAVVNYANKQRIPVVVDIRDLWPEVYLTMIPAFLHPVGKLLLYAEYERVKFILSNATSITAVSKEYLYKGIAYAGRAQHDRDSYFPLGSYDGAHLDSTPSEEKQISILAKYGIDETKFIVTFVGTFSKFLDVRNILDAAALLIDKKKIRIIIVGTGKHVKNFSKKAACLPNVTMTGWLNAESIRAILNYTNVGLAAYAKDALMSLPNKPFEYMAAGLPLLSSLPGELSQLINKYGIGRHYKAGDPRSMAEEICWFYNHPEEAKNMGKRSFDLFSKKYRSDIVYKEFSEFLERIVSCHGRR